MRQVFAVVCVKALGFLRGRHFASEVFKFYEGMFLEHGLGAMCLKVHKQNELALRAYRGKGFQVIGEIERNIGNGFVLDGYIMEKKVCR